MFILVEHKGVAMLFINNPEAMVAIADEGRRELGLRSTTDPDHLPAGIAAHETTRPRPSGHLFRTRIASTG
jgi:hypothetical protein